MRGTNAIRAVQQKQQGEDRGHASDGGQPHHHFEYAACQSARARDLGHADEHITAFNCIHFH
jgi:hypothetical protein